MLTAYSCVTFYVRGDSNIRMVGMDSVCEIDHDSSSNANEMSRGRLSFTSCNFALPIRKLNFSNNDENL